MEEFSNYDEYNLARYEEGVVKTILPYLDPPVTESQARRACRERMDSKFLSLYWLYDAYPGFPLRLTVGKFAWLHSMTYDELTRRPSSLPFVKALLEFVEAEVYDRDVVSGVVFRWPSLRHGRQMVCHDGGMEIVGHLQDPALIFEIGKNVLCLEPLKQLLDRTFRS